MRNGWIIDDQDTRARDTELVRTLEANGLTLLAAAVTRELLRTSDRVARRGVSVAGRECRIIVLHEQPAAR